MEYFKYGDLEKEYLSKVNPVMKGLIEKHGHIERKVNKDHFSALVSSIIGQQISTKASLTVEKRLFDKSGGLSVESLVEMSEHDIQQCGLSFRKAGYIKGIAQAAKDGSIDFYRLRELENQEIIKSLVSLKGVGKWTAEMMLIFSFERMDVINFEDLGIRRGLERAYGIEKVKKEHHEYFKELFSPYATVASFYLWEESQGN